MFNVNSVVPLAEDGHTIWGYGGGQLIKATQNGLERIDLSGLTEANGGILGMACDKDRLWLLTSRRVIAYEKSGGDDQ